MNSGEFKHKIWIYKPVDTQDANGVITREWTKELTMRCAIEPMSGRELEIAQSQGMELNTKITIRYWKGLKTTHRLITNFGELYEIGSIIDKSFDNTYLQIYCKRLDEKKSMLVLFDEDGDVIYDELGDPMLVSVD